MTVRVDTIREAATRVAASHGLEVVDVELSGSAKDRALRIFLEKNAEGRAALKAQIAAGVEGLPEVYASNKLNIEQLSGITHEDLANFSCDFGTLLDVEDLVEGGEYTLEVSSPGLDRKLNIREDFSRFSGSLAKVQTYEAIAGNRLWQGRIGAVTDTGITLDLTAVKQKKKVGKTGLESVEIALSNVEKAQLVPEF